MKHVAAVKKAAFAPLVALVLAGCSTSEPTLPPERIAPPARKPDEVLQALPGEWRIDVDASADALARAQYRRRPAKLP
jgi:predicted component of type VI protein secretion system